MAININKFVDITSVFPSSITGDRSFGGLVFTGKSSLITTGKTAEDYNAGEVIKLRYDEVPAFFGADSRLLL